MGTVHDELLERRKHTAVERGGKGGAAGVGDLGVAEVEHLELRQPYFRQVELLELRQHSSRRWRRTCKRRRRQKGGETLVAERVIVETETLQRGQSLQGRREVHQRVADGGVAQTEVLEPRQGASAQGGGERRGAGVARVHAERARAQPLRQPPYAVGAGCWLAEDQRLERWQHRAQRAQQPQVGHGEVLAVALNLLRLAQLLAAPQPHFAAQRCGRLVISPQLLLQLLRRRPQLMAGAAQGHGEARIEHVAQLGEEDALLVTAQPRFDSAIAARRVNALGGERGTLSG
eukprot:scaffold31252_cov63-Phaeocystis_antarctica.AAC.2